MAVVTLAFACFYLLVVSRLAPVEAQTSNSKFDMELKFYLHHQFAEAPGYPVTELVVASTSGNYSYYAFGNLGVAEQVIREGPSKTSTVIGRAPGTFVPSREDRRFALNKILSLSTAQWKGTIVLHSDWLSFEGENEWAVVGGTRSFRMVTGYAVNTLVDSSPTSATYKWKVYLRTHK